MTVDTVIAGGTIVTPEDIYEGSVAIDGSTITAVGARETLPEAEQVIDATGKLITPGFVDPHVHIDDSASIDTYRTATEAAALGGITTVVDFAWQTPENDPEASARPLQDGVAAKKEKAQATGPVVDYGLHGGVTVETPDVLEEIPTLVEEGITSFKMFTAYDFGISNGFIEQVLEELANLGAVGVFHTEDDSVCRSRVERYKRENKSDPTWYPNSRPDYAEAMAAEDCLRLAEEAGAKYYGIHTSCRKAADVIDNYREDGTQVRAETCTHYTALTDDVYAEQGNLPLIAPPIRKADDVEAMFEYLASGSLDVVSTDHAPHPVADKRVDWWDSPYGAGSLQASVPVFHQVAINEHGFSYPFLVRVMSTNPARIFGLAEKGTLTPETDADLIVFDPDCEQTITAEDNASNGDFSIYEGQTVTGAVKKTFVRGTLVADDGEIVAEPGHGEFVKRKIPTWSV